MNSSANKLLLTMAQNLRRAGQNELALSVYRRYIGLEPTHLEALLDLGGLLFEANEHDQACKMFERAIAVDPQGMDHRLTYVRLLIKAQKWEQADLVLSATQSQAPARKSCLVRHTQVFFQKTPEGAVKVMEAVVRIGDLVGLMICAEYMKRFEGCRIVFQLIDKTHKNLKADVLFQSTIDQIVTFEGSNFGFEGSEGIEPYDPGNLWMASSYYHQRHGGLVLPRLSLDPAHYTGPEMAWGTYAVFSPLFDPSYNKPRGMEESFVNEFCEKLYAALGDRAIVITDQPQKINSKIRTITTDNLYDLAFLVGRSKVFLGGDTGFTHLAAAGRIHHLFALYGANYGPNFETAVAEEFCFSDLIPAFTAPGKYWGARVDTRPKCDPDETTLHFHLLQENRLPELEMDTIIKQVKDILGK